MKLSSIYGKKVLGTAGKEGYVLAVYVKENKIEGFVCADENENEFTISYDSIKSIRAKITFKDGKNGQISGMPLSLGRPVFDCTGEYFGKLTDFTVEKNELVLAHAGNKKFSCNDIVVGDAIIIKSSARILKSDVKKGNRVIIKRGTPLTPEVLKKAQKKGEYVQANLKTF